MRSQTPSLMTETDDRLAGRYLGGESGAGEELFRRYHAASFRVAYRLLGNEADAMDAVQDGFLKALTHLDGFEQRASFKTWLLRVIANSALDIGRRRKRRDQLTTELQSRAAQESDRPQGDRDPADLADEDDLRRMVQAALMEIPDVQRRTFVLHVDGGLSYREISEVMEVSIGTVMSRLYYARQKLRGILAVSVNS